MWLILMMIGHIALTLYLVMIKDGALADAIFEVMYLWLAYYCFMTMMRVLLYLYSAVLMVAMVMCALGILGVMASGDVIVTLVFPLRTLFYGYGGYTLFLKMRIWANADPKVDLADGNAKPADIEKQPQ